MNGIAPGIKEGGELGEELQLVSYGSRIWILVYSLTSSIGRGSMVKLVKVVGYKELGKSMLNSSWRTLPEINKWVEYINLCTQIIIPCNHNTRLNFFLALMVSPVWK